MCIYKYKYICILYFVDCTLDSTLYVDEDLHYHKHHPNVGKYTLHGSYGVYWDGHPTLHRKSSKLSI